MVRPGNAPYPVRELPPGFEVLWYHPGWERHWLEIQTQADPEAGLSPATFERYFGGAPDELPHRQAYLADAHGRLVATATAWFGEGERRAWGRLHWVAVAPEYQGRGLAQGLLTIVGERLRSLHPAGAFLRTAAHRLAAIAVYLRFGFQPEPGNAEEAAWWEETLQRLQTVRGGRPRR